MIPKITNIGRYKVEDYTNQSYDPEQDMSLKELAAYQRRAAKTLLLSVKRVEKDVIKYARKSIGLTREKLAEVLDTSVRTIERYESGVAPISIELQLAMAALITLAEEGRLDEDVMPEWIEYTSAIIIK